MITAEELYEKVSAPTTVKGKSGDICRSAGLDPDVLEDAVRLVLAERPDTELLPTGAIITLGILFGIVALEANNE